MAKRFGVMLDMSRNAVMKPEEVKRFAKTIKGFGYNMIQMYTEDTYEIPEEPSFGYLRGRYSQSEIKDMVAYCDSIGVELVPCVQTLAHLNAIFHWETYYQIKDIDDILIVGDERTYELIDNMFKSLRECYTSEYIHIGMDEAHHVGLGKYLDEHGFENRFGIIRSHLERVIAIAEKYNFKPLMWSDMFFRLATKGGYYINDPSIITDEVVAACPDGVDQVYWDYYHTEKADFDVMIEAHKKFKGETWFAGGAWVWSGFVPNNIYSMDTMLPAMESCREHGVENIMLAMWGDDGRECSPWASLPSLFAIRRAYDGVTDMEIVKREFYETTREKYDDMMLLGLPLNIRIRNHFSGVHKYYLYNDPFLGIFDKAAKEGLKEQYEELSEKLYGLAGRGGDFSYLYESMAALANVLSRKYDLGAKTRDAYKKNDAAALAGIVKEYEWVIEALEVFVSKFRALWYHDNKPHGFDVQDIRLGGLLMRLRSAKERIVDYLDGKITDIPELEEEILPYKGIANSLNDSDVPCYHGWEKTASINRFVW